MGWISVEYGGWEVWFKSSDFQNGTQINIFPFYYYIFTLMPIRRNYYKYIKPWDLKNIIAKIKKWANFFLKKH